MEICCCHYSLSVLNNNVKLRLLYVNTGFTGCLHQYDDAPFFFIPNFCSYINYFSIEFPENVVVWMNIMIHLTQQNILRDFGESREHVSPSTFLPIGNSSYFPAQIHSQFCFPTLSKSLSFTILTFPLRVPGANQSSDAVLEISHHHLVPQDDPGDSTETSSICWLYYW